MFPGKTGSLKPRLVNYLTFFVNILTQLNEKVNW